MHSYARFMETQLEQDIATIDQKISARSKPRDLKGRCAQAYLKALRRNKEESLALLKFRRAELHS
ncbi:MAG: hypothetical protein H6983_23305 [Ectothiorhodospiraceae bacterium]|nr:hypothetical protein [Chromatiales bacterium]MCP5157125.1 hypothetical protein [Ectothiorhodospiraceae bacterium]